MRTRRSAIRTDSFFNALSKLGGNYDKRAGAIFGAPLRLDDVTLDNLFHYNDLASTICTEYPNEALRQGFEFRVPDDLDLASKVTNRLEEMCVADLLKDAAVWGRVFGDACLFLGVDDGQSVDKPLDYARVKSVKYLSVYDKRDFTIQTFYNNPLLPKFNQPELYRLERISPIRGTLAPEVKQATGILIHESRLVWFHGAMTSRQKLSENAGWHHSVLQKPYEVIRDFEMTWAGAAHLMQEASIGVYKVKDLLAVLSSEKGAEGLQRRMEVVDEGRSVARSMVVDADGEGYERVSTTFTGIPDMLDRFAGRLSAAAGIPVTRFMGEAPAGLNATGEGDARTFYDRIQAYRVNDIQPGLERIVKCFLVEALGGLSVVEGETDGAGNEPDWSIEWPALYQPTEKEKAEIRKTVADTDKTYIDAGVLDPAEVTLSRFGEGGWSMDTTVDLELRQEIADGLTKDDIRPPEPDPNAVDPATGKPMGGSNAAGKVAKKPVA